MQRTLSRRDFLKAAAMTSGAAALAACVAPAPDADGGESEAAMAPVELQWWSFGLGLPGDLSSRTGPGSRRGPTSTPTI